jgi:HlyD family secretion protein
MEQARAAAAARWRGQGRGRAGQCRLARAALSSNETQRYKAVIRSPVNGVVLARQIDAGQTVAASFNADPVRDRRGSLGDGAPGRDRRSRCRLGQAGPARRASRSMPSRARPSPRRSPASISARTCRRSRRRARARRRHPVAGGLLCRDAERGQCRPGTAPGHDRDRGDHHQGQAQRAARSQCGAALPAERRHEDCQRAAQGGITGALAPPRGRGGGGGAEKSRRSAAARGRPSISSARTSPSRCRSPPATPTAPSPKFTGGDLKPGMKVITGQLASEQHRPAPPGQWPAAPGRRPAASTKGGAQGGSGGQSGGQ